MFTQDQIRSLVGATAYDSDGDKIGKVGHVYFDDQTDQPKWITVNTGLFGLNESFVPLAGAESRGDDVVVRYDKATVKDAPNVDAEGHLSVEEEERLYRHYGLDYASGGEYGTSGTDRTTSGADYSAAGTTGTAGGRHELRDTERSDYQDRSATDRGLEGRGHDTSGPNTDDAMTRSEERLNVGTETREAGRARLRKHVVTEHQQVQVPVSREEVRVEREPITDANRGDAVDGPAISEEEHEVTLREERPVVDKEAVPVERVRLGTETVRETETVGDEVRREEIEVDDDARSRRR
ncbi:DUF2382 domain-containing protein [Pseudonocardia humida]|uniref:PRC and DUF2382 domain-containing protein n=1 Tax=Pseudonocardia humida TaxID=2800819 RepID=A0ABT0ZYD2_9PSEU|nr:PRC and DUF2382 domain-containing protein [Pseudonocardia humida]MCO1655750.1 PRC and DUF2382 domain-containing protein [Pseudonocardia humida]